MLLKGYRPSIHKLQSDFAARIARRKMMERRGSRPPKSGITDNSVPWMEKPDSVADYLEISRRIQESESLWLSRFKTSSIS